MKSSREISLQVDEHTLLQGSLKLADQHRGLIIFSHGSGSSRFSPRNQYVAGVLNRHGFSTLLTDLLTPEEDLIYENRFNISLLSERLVSISNTIASFPEMKVVPLAYFGASTGAASALNAAAVLGERISAVVSRGGRPDLSDMLPAVKAPALLIVGSLDHQVIDLNRKALDELRCPKKLVIVPNAGHLFEEPGTLDEVARLATQWFLNYLLH